MNGLAIRVGRTSIMDYVRRPLNLVMLLAVPPLIVVVWGAPLADFSKVILGGSGDRSQIEAATAGWAAAMLAGITGFFQVTGSLATDRRLAAAGRRSSDLRGFCSERRIARRDARRFHDHRSEHGLEPHGARERWSRRLRVCGDP